MATFDFDPSAYDAPAFEPLPAGEYPAIITDSEMKPTADGTGSYLQVSWQVIDGAHKGRVLVQRFNLVNKNPKAVQIAQGELSGVCKAMGLFNRIQDTAELHNRPAIIKVKVRPGEGDYEPSNDIKGAKPMGGATTAPAAAPPAAAPTAAPPPAAAMTPPAPAMATPWEQPPA